MACNCKHNKAEIEYDRKTIWKFKKYFIQRMTVDSKHNDRRRKDFNQAIFSKNHNGKYTPCFSVVDLDMIMDCFENAVKDYIQNYCDVENCSGNK